MKKTLRIALAQINTRVGDIGGNVGRVRDTLADVRRVGADLVVFPELTLPGYPPEDLLLKSSFVRANRDALDALIPETGGLTAVIGFADREEGGALFNAVAVAHDGHLSAIYRKHLLPNYGVFDEARYFRPGRVPLVVSLAGIRIGMTVCEDIWVEGGPGEDECHRGGARVLINPSASPFHVGKPAERERVFGALAARLRSHVLVCNLVGGQDELVFDGNSVHLGPDGAVRTRARAFEEDLLVVEVPLAGNGSADGAPETDSIAGPGEFEDGIELVVLEPGDSAGGPRGPLPDRPPDSIRTEVVEMYEALRLGTADYVRKNGFGDVVIGLSGEIDSALTAAIAVDALGADSVVGVAMPSGFSSRGSVEDARALADRLGIRLHQIAIGPLYDHYGEALAPLFADTPFGLAEENLQARIRGNLLMALSNKFGWMVLTTGNKSEVAVGYTTLYGDTAGGFAVLKDVYKTSVFALSRYRNTIDPVIPESILTKPPSAELRPDQKDTDSLPPYEVLDSILEAYVERDLSATQIVDEGFERTVIESVMRMVDRAEYKRRQSPPGVKITARAFGKDRRVPITSGWVIGSTARGVRR